jgi:hypothetical protein
MVKSSWNANTYAKPSTIYAGMGSLKPLHAVTLNLLSMIQKIQEIQWALLILDLHTLTLLILRLDNVVKGMSNTISQHMEIVSLPSIIKFQLIILVLKLLEINGYVLGSENDFD